MRLSAVTVATLSNAPQVKRHLFEEFVRLRDAEIKALTVAPAETVQVFQGRVQMLDLLVAELAK